MPLAFFAAINEAVSVACEGAARDGVDIDETVIKNTEIRKSLSRFTSENSSKGDQIQNSFLESLTTTFRTLECSIEFNDP